MGWGGSVVETARKGNGENSKGGVKTLPMKKAGPEVDGPGGWCGSFDVWVVLMNRN